MILYNPRTLAKLRDATRIAICTSELLMNRYAVEEMLRVDACDVVMTGVTWAGGITEARKIANMAETQQHGHMQPTQRPGLGVALRPEALERDDCRITILV